MSPAPRIAINGRFLTQRSSGVQRFAMEAIKAIDALLDTRLCARSRAASRSLRRAPARDFPLKNIPLRRVGHFSGYAWEQLEFPLHAAGRLLLNLCMLGPLADAPSARRRARRHRARAAGEFLLALPRRLRLSASRGCAGAPNSSVTVSEFSRREIGKWYGADITRHAGLLRGRRPHHRGRRPINRARPPRSRAAANSFSVSASIPPTRISRRSSRPFSKAKLDDTAAGADRRASDPKVFGQIAPDRSREGVRMVGFVSDARTARALRARAGAGVSRRSTRASACRRSRR